MHRRKNLLNERKHFKLLILFGFLIIWFEYLKKTIVPEHIIYCKLDSFIPFVKEFIIFYYLWFFYMAFALLYFGLTSKIDFYKLFLFLSFNMAISYIIFMIYPNAQFPRPIIAQQDILSRMVKFIYDIDKTNNVFPSIHVANAIAVHLSILNSNGLRNKNSIKLGSLILMVLICVSTVFVKQHSIIDVCGGIGLAALLYILIYQVPKLVKIKSLN